MWDADSPAPPTAADLMTVDVMTLDAAMPLRDAARLLARAGVRGAPVADANGSRPSDPAREADDLYAKLEAVIAPLFYGRPRAFAEVMRSAVALNGSFYNAQRMVQQYVTNAYRLDRETVPL